jgi:8-oxo-dGTP diphosphatase
MTQPTPDNRPPIAAAIIVKDGRVLLVQRRVKEGSLSWQFPAGEVEAGETASQAAVRETQEETGLTVTEKKILGERIHPNTGRTMIYVACDAIEGDARVVDDEELTDIAWSKRDQLTEYVPYGFYPAVQDYLEATLDA